MPVDTAKVEGRRTVEYHSLDDVVADADRLTSGPLKTLGNWSAGQIFRHLATAVNGSIDGFKSGFPWFIRVPAKLFQEEALEWSDAPWPTRAAEIRPGSHAPPDHHRRGPRRAAPPPSRVSTAIHTAPNTSSSGN